MSHVCNFNPTQSGEQERAYWSWDTKAPKKGEKHVIQSQMGVFMHFLVLSLSQHRPSSRGASEALAGATPIVKMLRMRIRQAMFYWKGVHYVRGTGGEEWRRRDIDVIMLSALNISQTLEIGWPGTHSHSITTVVRNFSVQCSFLGFYTTALLCAN